jgi:PBSX family phage terminase large subunit
MLLTPAQSLIAKDTHRFRVLSCGRRFGKTVLAVEEMVGYAIKKKDTRVAYFAPTRDDAREIAWSLLVKKCENIITYKNESLLHIKIMTQDEGESMIALYGWESVQERGKGRGLANDFIVCDEVSSYRNFWVGWNEVLSPTLIDRKGSAMFISTPKGFNHFFDLYNFEKKDPDYKSFHFTTFDNPHIPPEEIERERLSKPEDAFAQEYLADFRKMTGLVYKEFDRDKHIYTDVGEKSKAYMPVSRSIGVDFGFKNPAVCLPIEEDAEGNYYITSEWYKTEQTTPEIIEVASSLKGNFYYPDPAEPDRIEEMRRAKLNIREVSKDIEAGINAVRELFKQNRLFIHESCVNLIAELESYRYPEKRPDNNAPENPIKENDHALDAMRYVIYMRTTRSKNTHAYVHYAQSSLPLAQQAQSLAPELLDKPKIAHTYRPNL